MAFGDVPLPPSWDTAALAGLVHVTADPPQLVDLSCRSDVARL